MKAGAATAMDATLAETEQPDVLPQKEKVLYVQLEVALHQLYPLLSQEAHVLNWVGLGQLLAYAMSEDEQ